ncbi:hypothetical protein C1646_758313 [Rhizophagus diaphanus]|nr:hypothetical protein C1646_758313 [Rhizophagus diaphanus] [Rhizophagus sp. MUCL 43196]
MTMTMDDEDGSRIYMIRNLKVRNSSFTGGGHRLIDGPILLQGSDDPNEQHWILI